MPTYEYRCPKCSRVHERTCRIEYRNEAFHCGRVLCERILTVPHTTAWNDQEIFPNLHGYQDLNDVPGGMQFESREAYDKYLKDEDIREVGVPRCGGGGPAGLKIKRYGARRTPPPARGSW